MIDNYIETRSGIKFHFLDPQRDEILIEDIAFALANQCRFNGHCNRFYSVAEHSVLVASLVSQESRLAALLHDASEAYLSDIPSPIKQYMPEYQKMEQVVQDAVYRKFNIDFDTTDWKEIKVADRQQLRTEAYNLLPSKGEDWTMWGDDKPDFKRGHRPMCFAPKDAFGLFMNVFEQLTTKEDKPVIVLA